MPAPERPSVRDPSVTFEEYMYWAKLTRDEESKANQAYLETRSSGVFRKAFSSRRAKSKDSSVSEQPVQAGRRRTVAAPDDGETAMMSRATQQDWAEAERALRTTGWGSVFFLLITDILGPMTTPWAFAQTGYGPGAALFTVFGALAA